MIIPLEVNCDHLLRKDGTTRVFVLEILIYAECLYCEKTHLAMPIIRL